MSPTEPSEGYVENYLLLIGDKHVGNFTRLLELKGIKKPEQGVLLDMFHRRIGQHDNLVDNSNLLPLDTSIANSTSNTNVSSNATVLPSSITTSLSTMASTAASNFNNYNSNISNNTSSTSPPQFNSSPTEGTRGRLNENFRKLVMTGMAFRKDLQERREHNSNN